VHPLWLGALAVLALNDHVLKGAGVLPGAVTGKLSDFAGMLVAPALLAALVGVRGRRGLLLAHLAVGVVFSAIQLSRPLADAWSVLVGLTGFSWITTCDPTDLVALSVLALGMHVYPSIMRKSAVTSLRRTGEVSAAGVGLFCCVATSSEQHEDTGDDWGESDTDIDDGGWLPEIEADVYLHNATGEEIVVRVRSLATGVQLDCDVVAEDPARLLDPALFGPVASWSMPVDSNIAVRTSGDGQLCHAALIDGDEFPTRIAFWRDGSPAWTWVAGSGEDGAAPGWIRLSFDGDREGRLEAGLPILFDPAGPGPTPTPECAAQDDGARLDWSPEVPIGAWTLAEIQPGLDGCTELGLAGAGDEVATSRWYVCTPDLELPFAAGDRIAIEPVYGIDTEGVRVIVLDALSDVPAEPGRQLVVARGASAPEFVDVTRTFVPAYDCGWVVDDCGTVARAGTLVLGGPGWSNAELGAGERVALVHTDGSIAEVAFAHGQDRRVLEPECAMGPDFLGFDVEVAATYVGAAQ